MRKKPYPITQLTGGLNISVDAVYLTDKQSPNLRLVRFHEGVLKKDYGLNTFSSVTGRPMLFDTYATTNGSQYLILLTTDKMYKYNTLIKSFEVVSGSNVFTGDEDDTFDTAIFNDLFILTNGKNPVYKWDGTTFALLGGLSSPDILCKNITPFYNHLVMGFTIENGSNCPQRIRWSDTGNPEAWDDTDPTLNAGYIDLSDTVDWITGITRIGDRLYVFKERSIWEISHVGGDKIFEARIVIDGVGSWAPHTIINLGEEIIFYGSDGVYRFDGMALKSVSEEIYDKLYPTDTKIVNASKLNRAVGEYIEETGDYILVLPTTGNDPDWMLKYNLDQKTWVQRNMQLAAIGLYDQGSIITWTDATGAWQNTIWNVTWKERSLPPGAPVTLYATLDGTVYKDDRLTESNELFLWESKDFIFSHQQRIVEVRIIAKGDAFDISYSINGGALWSQSGTVTPSTEYAEYILWLNVTCRRIRFRIKSYNGNINIKYIEPWYIPRTRSDGGI